MLFRIFHRLAGICNDLAFRFRSAEQDKWAKLFPAEVSLRDKASPEIHLLANGPSLREVLRALSEAPGAPERDYCVVNYFANEPAFERLRPRYCIFSDPGFYRDTPFQEKALALYRTIAQKVTWPMVIFIQYKSRGSRMYDALKSNPCIEFRYLHSLRYTGDERKRIARMVSGVVGAECGNVVPHALYVCMHLGYKKIHLYGVDHNFFDGMCLNEKNELCTRKSYFYEKESVLEPIRMHYFGEWRNYTVAEFLQEKYSIFRQYEVMRRMAESMGCRIINHTPGSLIDAFEHAPVEFSANQPASR